MPDLQITEADNGKEIELGVGQRLTLALNENPTTGYMWSVACSDETILHVQDAGYMPAADIGVGAGGIHRFVLTGATRGHTKVECRLSRSWEAEGDVTKQLQLGFVVI